MPKRTRSKPSNERQHNKVHKDLKGIPEQKLKEYRECFEMFDQNGDGVITTEEMVTAMRGLGHNPTRQEVSEMLGLNPADGDGKITFPEFCKHLANWPEEKDTSESLIDAFKVFDKDNDGFITADELKEAMQTLGDCLSDKEVDEMIKQADRNSDGKIDITEFSNLLSI